MKRCYNPDEYFLVQHIITNEVYAIAKVYKVKFKAAKNDGLFPCYSFSAQGAILEGNRKFYPQQSLLLFEEEVINKAW